MIGIFYPYLEKASLWQELRYSLRSLEGHLKENFEVWIVGDLPDWIQNVKHLPHKKIENIHAPSTFDAVKKLQAYLNQDDSPETFIRMYDDVYFLGDRNIEDLQVTRYLFNYGQIQNGELRSGSQIWRNQVLRSVQAARQSGHYGLMTETHCPEVFEKQKMAEVMELFDPDVNRLLTSTLYFNLYPYPDYLQDLKTERALFYGYENAYSFHSSNLESTAWLEGKYFLNHNDVGLDGNLKAFISGMFPHKSRFEK